MAETTATNSGGPKGQRWLLEYDKAEVPLVSANVANGRKLGMKPVTTDTMPDASATWVVVMRSEEILPLHG